MSKASIISACNTEFGALVIKDKATGLMPNGDFAVVGSSLFKGLREADAGTRASSGQNSFSGWYKDSRAKCFTPKHGGRPQDYRPRRKPSEFHLLELGQHVLCQVTHSIIGTHNGNQR